jgi:pyruvate kinase
MRASRSSLASTSSRSRSSLAADVEELRALAPSHSPARLIAKIEKPEAMDSIEEIVAAAEGIMIARGDLGVELDREAVPTAQLGLLELGRAHAKPAIVATQMLESMTQGSAADPCRGLRRRNGCVQRADAVMLSAETASGRHPVCAVTMLDRIARRAETHQWHDPAGAGVDPCHAAVLIGHRSAPPPTAKLPARD